MEKFRVLSDLHMDINEKYPFSLDNSDVFTVIAGDTSGLPFIISAKCDNPHVGLKVESGIKIAEYFKNKTLVKIKYDSSDGKWKYNKKVVTCEESGLLITENGVWDEKLEHKTVFGIITDGETITLKIKSPERWIRKNVKNGIVVAGNHLVYNRDGLSIEGLKRRLGKIFPVDSDISFLDNSIDVMSKEVDGILFVGSTLYTDYKLPISGENDVSEQKTIDYNKRMAAPKMSGGGLNDFNFGRTEESTYNKAWSFESDSDLSYITPENYERFFHRTFSAIKKIVEDNPNKEIVIVTHHCPSPKCIDSAYVDSPLNASYVSNLEDFIVSHKNIKCWVCGHVHHRASFKVGDCLVVMNPLGYCKYGEFLSSKDGVSGEWTPNTYVNVKTWTVEKEPFDMTKWKNLREKERRASERWYKKYGGLFF